MRITLPLRSLPGFTLIEILVSVSLFTTVMVIATGALYSAQVVNNKLQQTQIIFDGLNVSTELMTRDMRYGHIFNCSVNSPSTEVNLTKRNSCPLASGTGGSVIYFKPAETPSYVVTPSLYRVSYFVENGILYKAEYQEGSPAYTSREQITGNNITIDSLRFFVTGAFSRSGSQDVGNATDETHPLVTLIISGKTKPEDRRVEQIRFTIQTSVSARGLDN